MRRRGMTRIEWLILAAIAVTSVFAIYWGYRTVNLLEMWAAQH